jgi:hypothetical protein
MRPHINFRTAAVAIFFAFAPLLNAISTKTGTTVEVDGVYYYVPPIAVSNLAATPQQLKVALTTGEDLVPLTVTHGDFATFNGSTIQSIIDSFLATDDVFSSGFLPGMPSPPTMWV